MSKRGGFPGGASFGGMNINNLMKEAKKMQADMEKSQAELATKEFDASAGGGAVTVKVSGEKVIKEIKVKPEVVDPEDVETLEDLITLLGLKERRHHLPSELSRRATTKNINRKSNDNKPKHNPSRRTNRKSRLRISQRSNTNTKKGCKK